jgi:hypothetical protein
MKFIQVKMKDGSTQHRAVIYTITSFYIKKVYEGVLVRDEDGEMIEEQDVGEMIEWGRTSNVGYYTSLERAQQSVENNYGHFDECGYYNYIMIESVVEGLYNLAKYDIIVEQTEWWYKYDRGEERWIPCCKPKCFCNVCRGMD